MATKTVLYKKHRIVLDDSNSLGTGGEATVILHGKEALKIYHEPSQQRAKKLQDFIKLNLKLPDNVARPVELVYNVHSEIIGFAMPAAKNCKEAIRLSNKKTRTTEQISTNDVIRFFEHMKYTLDLMHKCGLFVADFNDLNVMYNDKFLSVFIDVDSYQFGQHPCPVGTELFLDPSLYGVDLSEKPYFSKETDWYSFAVMLFKSLLWTHPYGGVHDTCQSLIERAKQKITVLDTGVIYPRIALKPETLSQELLDHFHTVFKLGKRPDMSLSLLTEHVNSFEKCNQCKVYYHRSRGRCPMCFGTTVQQPADVTLIMVKHTIDTDKCKVDALFTTEGIILFSKVLEDKRIILIEYTGHETALRIISSDGNTVSNYKLWTGHIKDVKYDFFKNYLVIGLDSEIMIFETDISEQLKPIAKTTTMKFDDVLIFGCSETKLYRLTDQALLSSEIINNSIVDTVITQTLHNQTWFKIGSSGLGFGFFRIFDKYYHFVFSPKGRYEVEILKINEKLIETVVEISKDTVLFLQKTLNNGRTYSYQYLINSSGKVVSTKAEESLGSQLLKTLQGKFLLGSSIIHPTDAGIVIERKGALTLKKETAKYVDSGCSLFLYKDGMLVISEHKVEFLRLIK
jgi:hypothetical protein